MVPVQDSGGVCKGRQKQLCMSIPAEKRKLMLEETVEKTHRDKSQVTYKRKINTLEHVILNV